MEESLPNDYKPKRKFLGVTVTKKKIIWTVIILLVVGLIVRQIFKGKNNAGNIQTAAATKQDLQQTVLTTGQVVSGLNLNLGFQSSGVVTRVLVKEGDKVTAGQTLATLNQSSAQAALTTAEGSLAQAQANYEKVVQGSTNTQIAVAEQAVTSARVALQNASTTLMTTQAQQDTAVANAYNTLLNTPITAVPSSNNTDNVAATITGTYTGTAQGAYNVSLYSTGSGLQFQTQGLETTSGIVRSQPVPLGTKGLYIQFSGTPSSSDTWTISIPNTYSS